MTAPDPLPRRSLMQAPAAGSPLTDESALAHLLDLAGQAGAVALLDQVTADLTGVRATLRQGLPAGDRGAIRSATHILMALAGTVGAPRLHAAALAVNLAAHADDSRTDTPAAAALMDDLSRLIDDIAARRARWKPA